MWNVTPRGQGAQQRAQRSRNVAVTVAPRRAAINRRDSIRDVQSTARKISVISEQSSNFNLDRGLRRKLERKEE